MYRKILSQYLTKVVDFLNSCRKQCYTRNKIEETLFYVIIFKRISFHDELRSKVNIHTFWNKCNISKIYHDFFFSFSWHLFLSNYWKWRSISYLCIIKHLLFGYISNWQTSASAQVKSQNLGWGCLIITMCPMLCWSHASAERYPQP